MPAKTPPAAARSWATARWPWAALGHFDEAIAEAGRALDLAPDSADPQSRDWASCSIMPAGPSDAIAPIQRALELDPAFAAALKTLALAQAAAGQGDEAVDLLQRALRANPHDRDAILQLSNLHIETAASSPKLSRLSKPI